MGLINNLTAPKYIFAPNISTQAPQVYVLYKIVIPDQYKCYQRKHKLHQGNRKNLLLEWKRLIGDASKI